MGRVVCGKVTEFIPHDSPTPKENHTVTVSYHDVNLYHNVIAGRSVTGVLHFLNKLQLTGAINQVAIEKAT